MLKKIAIVIVCFHWMSLAFGQVDQHFTQYYTNGTYLNPALTGVINEGDLSVTAIRRTQWNKITNPYITTGIAAEILTRKNWGFGINVMQQQAGNAGYNHSTALLSICNNNIAFGFDNTQYISIAIQGGISNKKIDVSKLTFGDQFNPTVGFDPSIISAGQAIITGNQITQIETGAGIFYYETSEENKVNSYGGIALAHIYSQKNSFNDLNVMLPMRLTLHGGAKINYSEKFSLSPNFIYMLQGNSFEFVPGVQSEYHLSNSVSLNTGINYRHLDAINALLGLRINKLSLGFSYDINVSDLNDYVKPVNSTEFSLKFITSRPEREKRETIKCPRL